jgi:hypothetical protein
MTKFDADIELFDEGAFTVYKTRWGTFASRDKEGNDLCSGLDKGAVIFWSREHLNDFQNSTMTVTNVSTVIGDPLK